MIDEDAKALCTDRLLQQRCSLCLMLDDPLFVMQSSHAVLRLVFWFLAPYCSTA